MFAFTRSQKMDFHYLQAMTNHARRQDSVSLGRVARERTADNLTASAYTADPTDLRGAYAERKARAGAKEYGKSAVGIHVLAGVSPEYIRREGDPHDPQNPANIRVFEHAQAWAEEAFGPGSVISSRMDMDEHGCGVVDLFIVPVRTMTMRGKSKSIVSVNKALEEIRAKHAKKGQLGAYGTVNDSWAEYAQRHLDPALLRGVSKAVTGREHVQNDVFREEAENISVARAEVQKTRQDMEEYAERVIAVAKDVKAKERRVNKERRQVEKIREELDVSSKWWKRTGAGLRSIVKGFSGLKSALMKAFEDGKEAGFAERQAEVDAANEKAEQERKKAEEIGKVLEREKASRAKDWVIPASDVMEYTKWKAEHRNAGSTPENGKKYEMGLR